MIRKTGIAAIGILLMLVCGGVAVGGPLSTYDITAGTATVDGDASDWTNVTWQVNTLVYGYFDNTLHGWSPGTNVGVGNEDITYATTKFAARWSPNDPVAGTPGRIYAIAVVDDSYHQFQDTFTEWCASDRVEWFVHGPNNTGASYHADLIDAQQYVMSPKLSDTTDNWLIAGYNKGEPNALGLAVDSAVSISGNLVTYEISFPVYDAWYGLGGTPGTETVADLLPGEVVGFDILVGSNIAPYPGGPWPDYSVNYYMLDELGILGGSSYPNNHKADGPSTVMIEHTLVAIPGDFDMDGDVDVSDLGILATNYGTTVGMTWREGDANGSGGVDVSDLGELATYYGQSTQGAAGAVPEPATLSLLGLGALALLIRRRRR
jgi:hypothetical protein